MDLEYFQLLKILINKRINLYSIFYKKKQQAIHSPLRIGQKQKIKINLKQPLKTIFSSVSFLAGVTTPGQSIRNTFRNNVIYCHTFVSPGIGATLHTFFFFNVLMTELFPTLGYP